MTLNLFLFLAVLTGVVTFAGLLYTLWPLTNPPPRRWPFMGQPLTLLDAQPGDVIVATQAERYFPLSYAAHMREIQYLHYNQPSCTTPVQVAVGDALVVQGWSVGVDPVLLPALASRADRAGADCQLVATHPRTGQTIYIWPHTGWFDLQETGQ